VASKIKCSKPSAQLVIIIEHGHEFECRLIKKNQRELNPEIQVELPLSFHLQFLMMGHFGETDINQSKQLLV
jgi:hypothetical protein